MSNHSMEYINKSDAASSSLIDQQHVSQESLKYGYKEAQQCGLVNLDNPTASDDVVSETDVDHGDYEINGHVFKPCDTFDPPSAFGYWCIYCYKILSNCTEQNYCSKSK